MDKDNRAKLLLFDLDGTLLRSDKRISPHPGCSAEMQGARHFDWHFHPPGGELLHDISARTGTGSTYCQRRRDCSIQE